MSKNLRTYGESRSREICAAGAFPGLFRGNIGPASVPPIRLRIQKSSFISFSLLLSPPPEAISKFATHNIFYISSSSHSLHLFFRAIFPETASAASLSPSALRLSPSLSVSLAFSQPYKIAAGKAQVGGGGTVAGERERERERERDAFTFKFLRNWGMDDEVSDAFGEGDTSSLE